MHTKNYNEDQQWIFNIINREIPEHSAYYSILKGSEDGNYCETCKYRWDNKYCNVDSDIIHGAYCLNCFFRNYLLTEDEKEKILKFSPLTNFDLLLNKFWKALQIYFIKNGNSLDYKKPVYRKQYLFVKISNNIKLPFVFKISWEPVKKNGKLCLKYSFISGDRNFITALGEYKTKIVSNLKLGVNWEKIQMNELHIINYDRDSELKKEPLWEDYLYRIFSFYTELNRVFRTIYREMLKTPNKFGHPGG